VGRIALHAERLTPADIRTILAQAASKALEYQGNPVRTNAVIAVSDREGYIVGVWTVDTDYKNNRRFPAFLKNAMGRAGTAAFLSSAQHAFSTRTANFIVQQHFPPGVENAPPGPLVGVNFSSLPVSDVNRFKNAATYDPSITSGTNGGRLPPLLTGGLTGGLGGVPLYKNGECVGGIGVSGDEERGSPLSTKVLTFGATKVTEAALVTNTLFYELTVTPDIARARDVDEEVALAGQVG